MSSKGRTSLCLSDTPGVQARLLYRRTRCGSIVQNQLFTNPGVHRTVSEVETELVEETSLTLVLIEAAIVASVAGRNRRLQVTLLLYMYVRRAAELCSEKPPPRSQCAEVAVVPSIHNFNQYTYISHLGTIASTCSDRGASDYALRITQPCILANHSGVASRGE